MKYLKNEIQRDGTSQLDRLHEALSSEYVKIDERSAEDHLEYFYRLAEYIVYYNEKNIEDNHWQDFLSEFKDQDSVHKTLEKWENTGEAKPHQALLATYLKLLEYAVNDINKLGQKHLDFFYNRVLRIERQELQPDKVHVLFELAKNRERYKLDKGTLLDAGKKADGSPNYYELTKEIILNQVKVQSLKSVFVETGDDFEIYSAPVANSRDGRGKPFESANAIWRAFGESQKDKSGPSKTMEDASVGFAIASKALFLQEGSRTITLKIYTNIPFPETKELKYAFKAYLSSEKGWIHANVKDGVLKNSEKGVEAKNDQADKQAAYNRTIELKIELTKEQPSVTAYNPAILSDGFPSGQPVLKLLLNHELNPFPYKYLKDVEVKKVEITVDVKGMTNLLLRNDQGPIPIGKPFMPFGPTPRVGSSFIVSSAEIKSKRLISESITLYWDALPGNNLYTHYEDYLIDNSVSLTNKSFKANLYTYKAKNWIKVKDQKALFCDSAREPKKLDIELDDEKASENKPSPTLELYPNSILLELDRTLDKDNKEITNLTTFGHQEFNNLYTNVAIKKAKKGGNGPPLPNQPYTPLLKQVTLDYTAEDQVLLSDINTGNRFFHINPFGINEIKGNTNYRMLPYYNHQGNFYIGLDGFTPPGNISLLFQVAEGTGEISSNTPAESISWSYLTSSGWKTLSSVEVITETTRGLQKTGIIEFALGSDAQQGGKQFVNEPGYYWIRGSIKSKPAQPGKLIRLFSNAATARHLITAGSPENIRLPAQSITKLVKKQGAVKKVSQPFVSFGGRETESDRNYFTRVSERLRHKQRAVTIWDFEHIVLQHFPDAYKVKCLKHADNSSKEMYKNKNIEFAHESPSMKPGSITLLIISNLRNQNAVSPLEPKTGYNTLTDIKNYASQYVSPWVEVNVENPTYERLLVDFKVGFYEGYDAGFYGNLLNEEIKKFLSPWAYKEGEDIIFGGKIYRSDILAFVENREYVDFVTEFRMYHIYPGPPHRGIGYMDIGDDFMVRDYSGPGIGEMEIGSNFIVGFESEIATATSPRSILVSADQHRIQTLNPGDYACEGNEYDGIGFMAIELNFDVE
ncbi:MAG: baseplate J/gp47 family protein [Bacteroidales bacterium]|nr:baseplate J/gp47 family protein [Bacteroidales bacterium]